MPTNPRHFNSFRDGCLLFKHKDKKNPAWGSPTQGLILKDDLKRKSKENYFFLDAFLVAFLAAFLRVAFFVAFLAAFLVALRVAFFGAFLAAFFFVAFFLVAFLATAAPCSMLSIVKHSS